MENEISLFDQPNPLLNSVVMDNILKRLSGDLSSLKPLRLVCKEWDKSIIPLISQVNSNSPFKKVIPLLDNRFRGSSDFDSFLSTMTSSPFGFFSKFEINCPDDNPLLWVFLGNHGQNIKSLDFNIPIKVHNLYTILAHMCPNLQKLRLNSGILAIDEPNDNYANSVSFMFQNIRLNINSLTYSAKSTNYAWNVNQHSMDVAPLFAIIKSSPKLMVLSLYYSTGTYQIVTALLLAKLRNYPEITRNLEAIAVNGETTPEDLFFIDPIEGLFFTPNQTVEELIGMELSGKLKNLELGGFKRPLPKLLVHQLLIKVKHSLEELKIATVFPTKVITSPHCGQIEFPQMDKLKTLQLIADGTHSIESLNFLGNLPNLKTLRIHLEKVFMTAEKLEILSQMEFLFHLTIQKGGRRQGLQNEIISKNGLTPILRAPKLKFFILKSFSLSLKETIAITKEFSKNGIDFDMQ